MKATRAFLGFTVLAWLPYGLYSFFQPDHLAATAGVVATSATGGVELRAMYGGLTVAVGVLAGLALVRASLVRPALVALAAICFGLGVGRLIATLGAGELSGYTAAALVLEWASALLAIWLLSRPLEASPA